MEKILTSPFLWVGVGIAIITITTVFAIAETKRRAEEVKELDKIFPNNVEGENISVERLREITQRNNILRKSK